MQRKHAHHGLWFLVALVAALIAAPNSMFIKVALEQIGPAWFNIFRLGIVSLVMLPVIIAARKKIYTREHALRTYRGYVVWFSSHMLR